MRTPNFAKHESFLQSKLITFNVSNSTTVGGLIPAHWRCTAIKPSRMTSTSSKLTSPPLSSKSRTTQDPLPSWFLIIHPRPLDPRSFDQATSTFNFQQLGLNEDQCRGREGRDIKGMDWKVSSQLELACPRRWPSIVHLWNLRNEISLQQK